MNERSKAMLLEGNESATTFYRTTEKTGIRLSKDHSLPDQTQNIPYAFIPERPSVRNFLRDERFGKSDTPSILLREAIEFARLLNNPTIVEDPQAVEDGIRKDVQDAELALRQYESIVPRLNWGEATLFDIHIRDLNAERKNKDRIGLAAHTTYVEEESDDELALRRNARKQGLAYATAFVQDGPLLEKFRQALSIEDETMRRETLGAIAEQESNRNKKPSALDPKVSQALTAIDTAHLPHAEDDKVNLLNLALDTATAAMEKPKNMTDKAAAHLAAARAVHDLAAMPGSFEQYMPEAEAREFRVRALELAYDWIHKAADDYRATFDQPIGHIDESNVDMIRENARTIDTFNELINVACWFEGVFYAEYTAAAQALERPHVRHGLGKQAVGQLVQYLHPANTTEQQPTQPNVALPVAA